MTARADVIRVSAGCSRGTGFLIDRDRIVTALHVLGRVEDGKLNLYGDVEIIAYRAGSRSSSELPYCRCRAEDVVAYNADLDWICLRIDAAAFVGVRTLGVADIASLAVAAEWSSYGFPDHAASDGKGASGTVTSLGALISGVAAGECLQLFSREASAGTGGAVHGFSGAPVVVNRHAVAMLTAAATTDTGVSSEGTLYAIPLSEIVEQLGIAWANVDKDAPTQLERRLPDIIGRWTPPAEGQELGEYRLQRRIGDGRFAQVWSALHVTSGAIHALKIFTPSTFVDKDRLSAARRFCRGAAAMHQLQDVPGVVRIFAGPTTTRDYLWFSMELCAGDLYKKINQGNLTTVERTRFVEEIGASLEAAHSRNIVHRDIRPQNILLREKNGHLTAVLSDFDLAYFDHMFRDETTKMVLGATRYQPPRLYRLSVASREELAGALRHRSVDAYALTVIAFDLFVGFASLPGPDQPRSIYQTLLLASPLGRSLSRVVRHRLTDVFARGLGADSGAFASVADFMSTWHDRKKFPIVDGALLGGMLISFACAVLVWSDLTYHTLSIVPPWRYVIGIVLLVVGIGMFGLGTRVVGRALLRRWPDGMQQTFLAFINGSNRRRLFTFFACGSVTAVSFYLSSPLARRFRVAIINGAQCRVVVQGSAWETIVSNAPYVVSDASEMGLDCPPLSQYEVAAASYFTVYNAKDKDTAYVELSGLEDVTTISGEREGEPIASARSCQQLVSDFDWSNFVSHCTNGSLRDGEWNALTVVAGKDGNEVLFNGASCGIVDIAMTDDICKLGVRTFNHLHQVRFRHPLGTLHITQPEPGDGPCTAIAVASSGVSLTLGRTAAEVRYDLDPGAYTLIARADQRGTSCTYRIDMPEWGTVRAPVACDCE